MFQAVAQPLFNIDIRALLLVLAGGNLISAVLVFFFMRSIPFARDRQLLPYSLYSRVMFAAAFTLFLCRGLIPDLLSVNLGNSLLLFAFLGEAKIMLAAIYEERKRYFHIAAAAALCCVTVFNIVTYVNPDPGLRTSVISFCVFWILCVPTLRMVLSGSTGNFKRTISIVYAIFLVLVVLRALTGMEPENPMESKGKIIQILLFLSLMCMMIVSLPAYLLITKEAASNDLLKMASTDALTGLSNRHAFFALADRLYRNYVGSRSSLSVLFIDIDDFKQINDTYGHDFGDDILACVADIFKKMLRPSDLSCRYGGEEFVVFLPRTDACAANVIGRRIMRGVAEMMFTSHPDFICTLSIGVSSGIPREGQILKDHIALADEALYAAKRTEKNKIVTMMPICGKNESIGRNNGSGNIKMDIISSTPDFILAELLSFDEGS